MNNNSFNIANMDAIYTGGNIWCFLGKLTDGNYFLASDLMYDVMIIDADPRETEDCWYREWQEEHMIYEYNCDTTHDVFLSIYKWLEVNDPHCGVYIEYSIDKLNEIFHTDEKEVINMTNRSVALGRSSSQYVWLAEHDDCFGGYKIQCVARTKEEAKAKVLERWIEVYKSCNKCDPDEYEIACAIDCISVTEMELGVPEGI